MGENGLLQKMKKPVANTLAGVFLLTAPVLSQAQKATPGADLEDKTHNTKIIVNYVNPPEFFINQAYWNFYNYNARLHRLHFRRYHRGNWINFYLHTNDLPGFGIRFNYQAHTPYYQTPFYNNHAPFFKQNIPQRKISPRIRNNTGRNYRR